MATDSLMVPLLTLFKSPTNPRKTFDQTALKDLAASIAERGVLQPLLARPMPNAKDPRILEVVAGERRRRAAELAGLREVPCVVKPLTDEEVLAIQLVENLQREDLPPLEEAEGYEALLAADPRMTVDDLAAKVGKSRAYVYNRRRLTSLVPVAREALREGKVTPAVAFLIARLPASAQPKATEAILEQSVSPWANASSPEPSPMSVPDARRLIETEIMLQLREAPFPTDRADLVRGAGPCAQCPKRTGNQRELFADAGSDDLCTDPACWDAKKTAYVTARLEAAEAAGQKVARGREAKKLVPYKNSVAPGYVDLDTPCWDDRKNRTYRELLGQKVEPVVVEAHDEVYELVPAAEVAKVLKRHPVGVQTENQADERVQREKEEKRQRKLRREAAALAIPQLVEKAELGTSAQLLEQLAMTLLRKPCCQDILDARELVVPWDKPKTLERELQKLNLSTLQGLVMEAFLTDATREMYSGFPEELERACRVYGVDLKAIMGGLDAAAAPPAAGPEPAEKKTKRGKRAGA